MRIRNLALTGLAAAAVAYYFDPVKGSARRIRLRGNIRTLTGRAMRRGDRAPLPENVAPVSMPEPTIVEEAPEVRPAEANALPEDAAPVSMPEPPTVGKAPEVRPAEADALPEDESDAAIARRIRTRLEERSDLGTGGLVIDVVRGVAYLRGELDDRQQFDEVVDLTGSVPGIRRVQSLLHLPESERIRRPQSRVISTPTTPPLGDSWNG
ncbi:MAG TPA: BON domain-containing protein [Actinomycetota bacterium]